MLRRHNSILGTINEDSGNSKFRDLFVKEKNNNSTKTKNSEEEQKRLGKHNSTSGLTIKNSDSNVSARKETKGPDGSHNNSKQLPSMMNVDSISEQYENNNRKSTRMTKKQPTSGIYSTYLHFRNREKENNRIETTIRRCSVSLEENSTNSSTNYNNSRYNKKSNLDSKFNNDNRIKTNDLNNNNNNNSNNNSNSNNEYNQSENINNNEGNNNRSNSRKATSKESEEKEGGWIKGFCVNVMGCDSASNKFLDVIKRVREREGDYIVFTEFAWASGAQGVELNEEEVQWKEKGVGGLVIREDLALMWARGIAIALLNQGLIKQLQRRMQTQKETVTKKERFLRVVLDEVAIIGFYAPSGASKQQYEEFAEEMKEFSKLKKIDRWKTAILAGDANEIIPKQTTKSANFGEFAQERRRAHADKIEQIVLEKNMAVVNSFHEVSDRATYKRGESEIDYFLLKPAKAMVRAGEFMIEDWGDDFDHKVLQFRFRVRSHWELRHKKERMIFTRNPKIEAVKKLSEEVERCEDLNAVTEVLVKNKDEFLVRDAELTLKEVIEVENVTDLSREKLWRWMRQGKRGVQVNEITTEMARDTYLKVGTDLVTPEGAEIGLKGQLEQPNKANAGEVEEIDADFSMDELSETLKGMKKDGGLDINGLSTRMVSYLGEAAKQQLLQIYNKDLKGGRNEWGEKVRSCRDFALYKKGDPKDPWNYRFIIITAVLLKILLKMCERRVAKLAEVKGWLRADAFGGREGIGTSEALLVVFRAQEDMMEAKNGPAARVVLTQHDLKKAFPRTDNRLVREVMTALGIWDTQVIQTIVMSQRTALHKFGEHSCVLPHGLKEGCTTSPLMFNLCFSRIAQWADERVGDQVEKLEVYFDPEDIPRSRVDAVQKLWYRRDEERVNRVPLKYIFFVDDSNVFDVVQQGSKEDVDYEQCVRSKAFVEGMTNGGYEEAEDKRDVADITEASSKFLGVFLDRDTDTRERIKKAWRTLHANKTRVSGAKASMNEKAQVIIAAARSVLTYGLNARGVSKKEMSQLTQHEKMMVRSIYGLNGPKMRAIGVNDQTLYRRLEMAPLETFVMYQKCKFFGHVARRGEGSLAKAVLMGKVFSPLVGACGDHWQYWNDCGELGRRDLQEKERRVVENAMKWFGQCGVERSQVLSVCRNRRLLFEITQERKVAETVEEWAKCKDWLQSERGSVVEKLCKKAGISNYELDTYKKLDKPGDEADEVDELAREGFITFNKAAQEMKESGELDVLDQSRDMERVGTEVRCRICKVCFGDGALNVERHLKDHYQDRGVKVYSRKRPNSNDKEYLTEYKFWDRNHSRFYGGGDTRVAKCDLPKNPAVTKEGHLLCPGCNRSFNHGDATNMRSRALTKWRSHMDTCPRCVSDPVF